MIELTQPKRKWADLMSVTLVEMQTVSTVFMWVFATPTNYLFMGYCDRKLELTFINNIPEYRELRRHSNECFKLQKKQIN